MKRGERIESGESRGLKKRKVAEPCLCAHDRSLCSADQHICTCLKESVLGLPKAADCRARSDHDCTCVYDEFQCRCTGKHNCVCSYHITSQDTYCTLVCRAPQFSHRCVCRNAGPKECRYVEGCNKNAGNICACIDHHDCACDLVDIKFCRANVHNKCEALRKLECENCVLQRCHVCLWEPAACALCRSAVSECKMRTARLVAEKRLHAHLKPSSVAELITSYCLTTEETASHYRSYPRSRIKKK